MEFDVKEYSEAIDDFLLKMEQVPSDMQSEIGKAMERLCQLLRIAKVVVLFYDTLTMERKQEGEECVFYECEDCETDFERVVKSREVTGGGNVVIYQIFQKEKDADWTETEKKKIGVLAKILFVYNGRVRVMKLAEFLMFKDNDMGIYNLRYFMKHTDYLISQGNIENYGACYFNLKQFSLINKQIGRDEATGVMKRFVTGLQSKLSENEIVCRIGGDNFVVLFQKEKLDDILDYLKEQEITYNDNAEDKVLVTVSAGLYMIPKTCRAATDIMDCVSIACGIAKNSLNESFIYYNDKIIHQIEESKKLEKLFPDAIKKEEFLVYYQPKVNLKNYRIVGAEALCRWYHKEELLPPNQFIPVFEQNKAICTLDFYMLEHVCQDIRNWLDEGKNVVKVSVNLSRCHFGDMNLTEHILKIIDSYRVPHELIEIELTETTTDVNFQELNRIVTALQKEGISTSVDDFGIGYSSLSLISKLPWNVIKIDKSFLLDKEGKNSVGHIMLKHIIAMAQQLGLEIVAEGVETAEHVKILKENSCYLAQGFYFDKPLPKTEFESRLAEID